MTLTLGGVVLKRKKNHTKARTLTRLEVETPLGVVEDENYSRCPTRFLSAMVLLLRSKQGLNVRSIQEEEVERRRRRRWRRRGREGEEVGQCGRYQCAARG